MVTPCAYIVKKNVVTLSPMSREINPFGVRMPPELKSALDKQARKNGRSLNMEIVERLTKSIEPAQIRLVTSGQTEKLSVAEQQLLQVFGEMPAEKQLALLALLRL